MNSIANTLLWTERFASVAVLLQTLELFQIKNSVMSVWSWKILKKDYQDFPFFIQNILSFLLDDSSFALLLLIRFFLALFLLVFAQPLILLGLLITTLLVCIRWRGTFNGGSDTMTVMILLALTIGESCSGHPLIVKACLWYIAFQTCLSYFIAGLVKLRKHSWRSGHALFLLVTATNYETPLKIQNLMSMPLIAQLTSWLILIFECSFPLALIKPHLCLIYISLAILFHLANFVVFGLNRFLFAWLAAYPALYWASHVLLRH